MRTLLFTASIAALAFSVSGCSFMKRGPDKYRDDTRALLETKNGELKACYDGILTGNKQAQGTVTVDFVVQKKTGVIAEATVDEAQSTAPKEVQDCVLSSMQGLALEPADADDGIATFSYEFGIAPGS